MRVHRARYTECIHVSSHKLKLPKDIHTIKVQTAPTYPPLPKSGTIRHSLQLNVKIYTELQIMITEKRITHTHTHTHR